MGRRRKPFTIRATFTVFDSQGVARVIADRLVNPLDPNRHAGVGASDASEAYEVGNGYDVCDGGDYYYDEHVRSNREVLLSTMVAEGRLVWVAADKREGIFCQPAFSTESEEVLEGKYSFIGYRFCKFQDGHKLLSWCSNKEGCPDCEARVHWAACHHNIDFPDQTAEDQLQGLRGSCACSELVLEAKGGEDALSAEFLGGAEGLQVGYTSVYLRTIDIDELISFSYS